MGQKSVLITTRVTVPMVGDVDLIINVHSVTSMGMACIVAGKWVTSRQVIIKEVTIIKRGGINMKKTMQLR